MARVKNTQLRAQHCQVYIHVFIPKYIFPTCYFCLNLNVISTHREKIGIVPFVFRGGFTSVHL